MPFAGFEDFEDCLETMTEEEGHDMDSAENICGALQAEEKSEHGNVEQLREALTEGAGLIADVGVDLVSGVDVPAVDSKWVMTKDADSHDYRATSPVLLSKADDEDQRISYAAAMIPREPDKEGDVVATPTVEKAAHDFLKQDGGVDTDHSLIDGEGEVVESWVLKKERTFDLPGGETETYGPGTWMVGIEWGHDAWERIKSGDLTGLSIYGMAEHVELIRSACGCTPTAKQLDIPYATEAVVHLVYESRTAAEKASDEIGLDGAVHEHEFDGMTVWMPGETHDDFVNRYMDLADDADTVEQSLTGANRKDGATTKSNAEESEDMAPDDTGDGGDPDAGESTNDDGGPTIDELAASVESLTESVESVKDAVETEKQDEQDAAATLAETYEGMGAGDILDVIEAAAGQDLGNVLEAIQSADKADDMDDDDEEDEEMSQSTEKRFDGETKTKGSDATKTASKAVTDDDGATSGTPSFAELAKQAEAEVED